MIDYRKDDFDGSLDDIMKSINKILNETGEGYETIEEDEIVNNNKEPKDENSEKIII